MKVVYNKQKLQEGIDNRMYDERNLAICFCGKHRYPSKLMLIKFFEQFKDIKGTADIWSDRDLDECKVVIHCDITYKILDLKDKRNDTIIGEKK